MNTGNTVGDDAWESFNNLMRSLDLADKQREDRRVYEETLLNMGYSQQLLWEVWE